MVPLGALWFGVSSDFQNNVNEAYKLTQKVLKFNSDYPYALSLAQMIERNYLGKLEIATGRLEKMMNTNDPSIMSSAASLARHCGQYDKSLSMFRNTGKYSTSFQSLNLKDLLGHI